MVREHTIVEAFFKYPGNPVVVYLWTEIELNICGDFTDVEKERSALENVPPNLYESVCVPDLSEFLGGYHSLAGGDQKVTNSGASSAGAHPPTAVTPTPASNASGYLHDGK